MSGMRRFDSSCADCFVFTYKEGLLSAVAHDLKIRVARFEIDVDEAIPAVDGRFDAASLRVVCAMRDGAEWKGALSDAQAREIERNIARDVLHPRKHPQIRYVSTAVEQNGDAFRIDGELSLHGRRKPVGVSVRRRDDRYVATARLRQPDFGIRPYSALFGTLRVRPDVDVQIVIPWPARGAQRRSES